MQLDQSEKTVSVNHLQRLEIRPGRLLKNHAVPVDHGEPGVWSWRSRFQVHFSNELLHELIFGMNYTTAALIVTIGNLDCLEAASNVLRLVQCHEAVR